MPYVFMFFDLLVVANAVFYIRARKKPDKPTKENS